MANKFYKVLNGSKCIHGTGEWFLPKGDQPGEWMPPIEGKIRPCENGYHLCEGTTQLIGWLGPNIYEAEVKGPVVHAGNKVVVRQARLIRETSWNDKVARLFAADCAARVLHIYEREYPNDNRVRNAIKVARDVASGELSISGLDAARAGVWAAVAAVAARDAGDAAWAARAAWAAARADAWAAAYAAAAWAAARDAETVWQVRRLRRYINGDIPRPVSLNYKRVS